MIQRLRILILLLPGLVAGQENGVPGYVLELPASVRTVLIAETGTATLHRFRAGEHGLVADGDQPISIGQNGVGKQKSGDQRTPLGVYFIVEELDTSKLHEKYGPIAFPLDYPNAWDKANRRSGDGIWIHGVAPGSGPRPALDTDGCIALQNDALLQLQNSLDPLQTPVIITRHMRLVGERQLGELRDSLRDSLTLWAEAYRDGDWHRFLSLYDAAFEYRGMNLAEWTAYKIRSVDNRPIHDFRLDDIVLLADPEDPDLYVSRFRQTIVEASGRISVQKRLYWRKLADGFRIVAEDNG